MFILQVFRPVLPQTFGHVASRCSISAPPPHHPLVPHWGAARLGTMRPVPPPLPPPGGRPGGGIDAHMAHRATDEQFVDAGCAQVVGETGRAEQVEVHGIHLVECGAVEGKRDQHDIAGDGARGRAR